MFKIVAYEALHVSHDPPYAIDVTDSVDIFTKGSLNKVRKKLKLSAQTGEPFWRYRRSKHQGSDIFEVLGSAVLFSKFSFLKQR